MWNILRLKKKPPPVAKIGKHTYFEIDFNALNIQHLYWAIFVVCNLFVLLVLYGKLRKYRVQRQLKIKATNALQATIDNLRQEHLKSRQANSERRKERRKELLAVTELRSRSPHQEGDDNSPLCSTNSSKTSNTDDEHTLFIADSLGRIMYKVPFRERDYVDAIYSTPGVKRRA